MHAQVRDAAAGWAPLRAQVASLAPRLSAPPPAPGPRPAPACPGGPAPAGPAPAALGGAAPAALGGPGRRAVPLCASCRGPTWPGCSRCYQCALQAECLAGLLPDVIVPIAYAAKGGEHAKNLWLYKSGNPGAAAAAVAAAAAAALRALLVVFLHDHGPCVWHSAGMAAPTHVALVPSGRGRPGPHPLRALAAPYLAIPWAELSVRSRDHQEVRDLDPDRFRAAPVPGGHVVLLDDTWTSGASAASATAALKLAGARMVAVVVLGRHVTAGRMSPGAAAFSPADLPFRPSLCAVHGPAT